MALLAACALVLVLAWQNRGLREERRWFVTRTTEPYPGMYVPRIDVAAVDGTPLTLGVPAAERQVLFFFTTTCPYCKRSAPQMVQAAQRLAAQQPNVQVLGVCQCSPAQAQRYAAEHGFTFPVTTLTDRRAVMLFRARNVPTLLALDHEGRVRYARVGIFDTTERMQDLMAAVRSTDVPPALATIEE
ncbi:MULTISPECIES: peroxiredoxin family protein [unclassified Xanthomonas]|uniref:peroxiredoxin family protein n=1 Tax=Xanthomonas sp. LMG 8992 TaxID=1591157 RepID=UPI0016201AA5|nr:TlpA disulfide reductase family protein [Xanthomonas sp. LMG 8992]